MTDIRTVDLRPSNGSDAPDARVRIISRHAMMDNRPRLNFLLDPGRDICGVITQAAEQLGSKTLVADVRYADIEEILSNESISSDVLILTDASSYVTGRNNVLPKVEELLAKTPPRLTVMVSYK